MAFQFMHIEAYGRKLTSGNQKKPKAGGHTVASIVAEAAREPGNTAHIDAPQPPIYLFGKPLDQLEAACEAWAASAVDASGKRLRKDALCLVAGVFSAPDGISPEGWEKIKSDAMRWLHGRYGERLQTVVEHIDESHPHCHFYVVPLPGERFDAIHDGKRAAFELGGKTKKGMRNQAYRDAMRAFQDDYYNHVGAPNGMTRIGPARRRLTREEWKLEQVQATAIALKIQQAEQMAVQATCTLKSATASVEAIRSDALEEIRKIQEKALKAADQARQKARQKGIEEGRKDAVEQFEKSSLWSKLIGLISRKDAEIETLKGEVKNLRKERNKALKEVSRLSGLVKSVRVAGRNIAERFLRVQKERDIALNSVEKVVRQRDHNRAEVRMMRERDESHLEVMADRDLHRAIADQLQRRVALLEAPLKAHVAATPPSISRTHSELEQTV